MSSLVQPVVNLKIFSPINTRGFHQDLLEVPASCSCLFCIGQEHGLVWVGAAHLARCWALCRRITESPNESQSCSCSTGKGEEWISCCWQLLPMRTCHNDGTGVGMYKAPCTAYQQQCGSNIGKYHTRDSRKHCPHSLGERVWSCEQKAAVGLKIEAHKMLSSKAAPISEGKGDGYEVKIIKTQRLSLSGIHGNQWRTKGTQTLNRFWLKPHNFPYLNIKAVASIRSAAY